MDTLYGKQRKILKIIYSKYKKNLVVSESQLENKLHISHKEMVGHSQELYKMGYIIYSGLNYDPKLTAKGLEYFPAETQQSIETILKSIICPILVSVITTSLTLWLKG